MNSRVCLSRACLGKQSSEWISFKTVGDQRTVFLTVVVVQRNLAVDTVPTEVHQPTATLLHPLFDLQMKKPPFCELCL